MKKAIALILTILLTATMLFGCGNNDKGTNTAVSKIVLEELCSEEYEGRLIGTEGNRKAEEYLEKYMKKLGIAPYSENNYKVSYKQITADPNKQNPKVTITYKDGSTSELIHGKDFYTNAATKPIDITIPLTDESDNILNGASITAWDTLSSVVASPEGNQNFGINISQELKNELMEKGAVSAKITADHVPEESELNNIVGIIKGREGTKDAVVLTAHFDHVGKQGDFLFNGVLDNASGTATLMSAAAKLKNLATNKKLDYDIVIAAVNSEETNAMSGTFAGSGALVERLEADYDNMRNINIDCVGDDFPLCTGETDQLKYGIAEKLKKAYQDNNITFDKSAYPPCDDTSFLDKGYPAATVCSSSYQTFIYHSNTIETSYINVDKTESIAKAVAELVAGGDMFIESHAEKSGSEIEQGSHEWFKQLRAAAAKQQGGVPLKPNQHMYIDFNDKIVMICGDTSFTQIDEFNKYYPDVEIPQVVAGYNLTKITLVALDSLGYSIVAENNFPKGKEKNKAYDVELSSENIFRMILEYAGTDGGLEAYVNKHGGELLKADEYTDITPIEIPEYGSFKLIAAKGEDSYYSIAKETDTRTIKINHHSKDMNEYSFTKDEMIALAQSVFPKNPA